MSWIEKIVIIWLGKLEINIIESIFKILNHIIYNIFIIRLLLLIYIVFAIIGIIEIKIVIEFKKLCSNMFCIPIP